METILEQQRRLHEERERVVDTIVKEWMAKKPSHKDQVNSEHRIKQLAERHLEATNHLRDLYEDKDGSRKDEISKLSGPNEFAEFYTRLKDLKEYYRKHTNEVIMPMSLEFEELMTKPDAPEKADENLVFFTGEEGYGKYLDLNTIYEKYINLKGVEKVDYVTYLSVFDRFFEIPRDKKTGEYKRYLEALTEYLKGFIERVKPLMDLKEELTAKAIQFDREWEAGTFPGWSKESGSSGALTHSGAYLELSPFNSADELMALGLDRLKSALMALGMKCGGTLRERAERLFMTKGKRVEDLDQQMLSKSSKNATAGGKDSQKREMASLESQLYRFVEIVSEQRAATKENVERKQARTVGEVEEEEAEEVVVEQQSDDSDDDDTPYNPKNLPMGWDGKPIPYWLYKLHGLNISYPCEICGNQVYKGPKAFQRHFSIKWRHAHGMRCLGIPNTAHFANITKIKDAIELWKKLKDAKEQEIFHPELEEEFEDTLGNVVTRRTFEDLKRQGML